MIDAADGLLQYLDDGICEVQGIRRCATLVEHHLQLRLGGCQGEHRLAEVLAELRIQPRSTDDDILASGRCYVLFAMQLCSAIDTRRGSLLVRIARHIIWLLAKDIVGRDVHQPAIDLLHGEGKVCRSLGIQLLRQGSKLRVGLAGIDIRPGSTVDNDVNIMLADHLPDVIHIGDIKVCGLYPILLRDISKKKIM